MPNNYRPKGLKFRKSGTGKWFDWCAQTPFGHFNIIEIPGGFRVACCLGMQQVEIEPCVRTYKQATNAANRYWLGELRKVLSVVKVGG